jgi:hypothetical protein
VALTVEEAAWMARRIPALEAVVSIELDHLEYESIQPEGLSIAPLTMTALPTNGVAVERSNNR